MLSPSHARITASNRRILRSAGTVSHHRPRSSTTEPLNVKIGWTARRRCVSVLIRKMPGRRLFDARGGSSAESNKYTIRNVKQRCNEEEESERGRARWRSSTLNHACRLNLSASRRVCSPLFIFYIYGIYELYSCSSIKQTVKHLNVSKYQQEWHPYPLAFN